MSVAKMLKHSGRASSPLGFVWHYVVRGRRLFFPLFALVFLAACCAVGVQYGMKILVDSMSSTSRSIGAVVWPLTLFVVLIGVESVFWRAAGWMGAHAIVEAGVRIRLDLFDRLVKRPLNFFSGSFSGALGGRITAVSGAFGALSNTFIWSILPPCTDFVGALVLFSLLDLGMSAFVFLLVITIGVGLFSFGLRGRKHHQLYAERSGWAAGELVDTISNIRLVKMFGTSRVEHERLHHVFNNEASAQRRSWTYLEKSRTLHDGILWVTAAGVLVWAIYRWSENRFSAGDVVLVSALTFRTLHGSRDLALALIGASSQLAVIRETLQLLSFSERPAPRMSRASGDRPPLIEMRDLSFSYDNSHEVLKSVNLTIPPGQKIGIIGSSGAGKSTLLSLIQGLHDPNSGEIRLDGQLVGELPDEMLRKTNAFVPQDVSLFHRSIMDNLRYGSPNASDSDVAAAIEAAQCQFIKDLPHGFDTIVGERGAVLSGGQRQRVAIARALLKGSPVLLLDEAASALDGETELRFRIALLRACADRTLISATHHVASLKLFDRIIVLKDGEVVEDGPPDAVLRTSTALAFEGAEREQKAVSYLRDKRAAR